MELINNQTDDEQSFEKKFQTLEELTIVYRQILSRLQDNDPRRMKIFRAVCAISRTIFKQQIISIAENPLNTAQ